jgi:acetolactate decarboxylase
LNIYLLQTIIELLSKGGNMSDRTNYLIIFLMALIIIFAFLNGNSNDNSNENSYFQVSNLSALAAGDYLGNFTVKELKIHGDTGIGTFNYLDGEMIEKNGSVYQVTSDGKVKVVNNSQKVPFAMVTEFEAENSFIIKNSDYEQVKTNLNTSLNGEKTFYAIVITGNFSYIQLRSVPAQNQPFPPLSEAIKNQSVFNHQNVTGTLIGFWCPAEYSSINQPGYHFHFISNDGKIAGHVLDFNLNIGQVALDKMEIVLNVPN